MVMDWLRSAYSTKARFIKDDPTQWDIIWYRCADGALPFPQRHVFTSLNWGNRKADMPGVGEVGGVPRPWRAGANPGVGGEGITFCGSVTDFWEGMASPLADPRPTLPDGLPACCGPPPACCNYPDGVYQVYIRYPSLGVLPMTHFSFPGEELWQLDILGSHFGLIATPDPDNPPHYHVCAVTIEDNTTGHFWNMTLVECFDERPAAYDWMVPLDSTVHPGEVFRFFAYF
jgi:hypothetical protein